MSSGQNQIDLFLLGKTGHGKSSTGNTILGREAFQASDSSESETYVVQVGWSRRLNRIIKVVDGPGICETRLNKGEAAKKMTKDMAQGIMQCPQGFHAMILVFKYGSRFTEEELSTVEMLKSLFGPSFVKEYCILVFTHGELFDMNNLKTPERTFQNWCMDQKGALQSLLQECDYKVVLFRNVLTDNAGNQIEDLLAMVENFKNRGVRYTSEIFQKAAASREQLIVKENAPELREVIQAKINLLMDGVGKVKSKTELTAEVQSDLQQLKEDARELEVEIVAQDKGTGVLDSLKQVVVNVLQSIASHEDALKEKVNKAEVQAAMAAAQQKYEESMQRLREEVKKAKKKGRGFWKGVGDVLGGILRS